ncbi:MAG: ABC transporter permease [Bacteroidales bacterium]|nr:ABC transporter permease [Bacteroidales bacterium]
MLKDFSEKSKFYTVIEASNPWKPFDFKEIFRYKDMLYFKILNGYKAQMKQTVFGYFWVFFEPAFNVVFFSLIFGTIVKIDTGNIPYVVFNATAVLGWGYLSGCMNGSIGSLLNESNLIQKIYFPRIFIPLIPCIIKLPDFILQFIMTLILMAFFGFFPDVQILLLIPILIIMFIYGISVGLLLSTFVLQYKDINKFWGYFMRFYVYAVPLAYPLTSVPEKYQWLYLLNPGAVLIESFRGSLIGTPIPWLYLGFTTIAAFVFLYISAVIFRIREPNVVDTL